MWYALGILDTATSSLAILAASRTSLSLASGRPYLMFSRMESLNKTVSCRQRVWGKKATHLNERRYLTFLA